MMSPDDDDWQTVSKKKTRRDSLGFPLVLAAMKKEILEYAEQIKDRTTICVIADRFGNILECGHSTWKSECDVKEWEVLDAVEGSSKVHSPTENRWGTACAEVHALYVYAMRKYKPRGAGKPKYSLAYDMVTGQYKHACKNCTHMLSKHFMEDVSPHREQK